MGTVVLIVTWVLRIAGLMSAADKFYAAYHPSSAARAQKAASDEDHRELAVAAAPDKPIDNIIDLMQHGKD